MKFLCNRRLCSYLILVGLLCDVSAAKQAENVKFVEETCVVAMLPGKGPGQYIYAFGKPDFFLPMCFAIDPNDGDFYIPEVDPRDNIRLHKFNRNGNFITMVRPEGKAHSVYDIAVSSNGDTYLYIERVPGQCISRYNHEGKLLNTFGPQGPITKKDMDAERKAMLRGEETNREKYFFGRCRIFILPNDKVFVVKIRDYEKRILDTYKFDGHSGRLLELIKENRDLPKEIAKRMDSRLQKSEALYRAAREQKRKMWHPYPLIGPDGLFYYMSVKPERLEIRQAFFRD